VVGHRGKREFYSRGGGLEEEERGGFSVEEDLIGASLLIWKGVDIQNLLRRTRMGARYQDTLIRFLPPMLPVLTCL